MQELTFEKWMKHVDRYVQRFCGLSAQDLPDVDYRGLYESGDTPQEAAVYAIEYAQAN